MQAKTNEELLEIAQEMGLTDDGSVPKRRDLMMQVLQAYAEQNGHILASGILSITNEQGYGFLKPNGVHAGTGDVYVSSLRSGGSVLGLETRWRAR